MTTRAMASREKSYGIVAEIGLLLGLAGLTTLAAKIAIVLPWTPVPVTLQVAAVIFAGAAFGARRGAISQALYLGAGLAGLPVFAPFTPAGPVAVLSPTFGYLLAFPLAAWLAGRWVGPRKSWLAGAASLGAIYALGSLWLIMWTGVSKEPLSAAWVLMAGSLPFLPFDVVKTALAVGAARPVRRRINS